MEKWLEIQLKRQAAAVPDSIRKRILTERFIEKAQNIQEFNTPMEYLFDVYEEFIDTSSQYDDFACHECRGHILDEWKKIKPFLEELNK